jgi:anti-sigma factor RsiW
MTSCEACQAQLLDHLYGLLDDAERVAVEEHLAGCPACQAAMSAVEAQRQLLAAAARVECPGVRFEPPNVTAPAEAPESLKFPQAAHPRRSWRRWALAASVLLVLGGMGGLAGVAWSQHREDLLLAQAEHQTVTRQHQDLVAAQQQDNHRSQVAIREIQDEIQKLEQKWQADLTQAQKDAAEKQLQVIIVGPKNVEAGANNQYRIETRRAPLPGKAPPAAPSKVEARVLDPKTGQVYYEKEIVSAGDCLLALPPNLPVKPGTQLALEVSARADTGAEAKVTEQLPLIGTLFLTHLTTDRPMYRPGEIVRFRSLTLERFSLKPAREDFALVYAITDPLGAEVFKTAGKALVTSGKGHTPFLGPDGRPLQGIGAGEFVIAPNAPGGEYTLTVADALGRFPTERRKFLVNHYQAPRLSKELEFTRKTYGPGDQVDASCKVARIDGGKAIINQPVVATAQVDGTAIELENKGKLRTDDKGNVPPIRFKLPDKINYGRASLSIQLTDGGTLETIVRPIPIVLKKLFVDFYPEGGDLVAGISNRVYFQARTTLNKPAELRGRIVDQAGKVIVTAQTLSDDKELGVNQGMGLCQFVPEAGNSYELKIDAPIGIEGRYRLPAVKAEGVLLTVAPGVVTDKIDVTLQQVGKSQRHLMVGAYCRGRVLQHEKVWVRPGEPAHVALTPAEGVGGVYRITVFEERNSRPLELVPVAERLIYRRPVRRLDLAIHTDKKAYSPGAPVTVSFTARDENQQAAPTVILVSAVDLGVINLADEKTARTMPAHFLLTTEVKKPEDLEYADFLLSDHPKAETALDLLLGTQGWRRFAEQDPAQFRKQKDQDAERLLVANGLSVPAAHDSVEVRLAQVDARFTPLHEQAQKKLAQREAEDEKKRQERSAELTQLQARLTTAQTAAQAAESTYRGYTDQFVRVGLAVLAALLLVFGLGGVIVGLIRSSQEREYATGYLVAGLCSLLLLLVGGAAGGLWFVTVSEKAATREMAAVKLGNADAPMPPDRGGLEGMAQADFDRAAGEAKEELAKAWKELAKRDGADADPGKDVRPLPGRAEQPAIPPQAPEPRIADQEKLVDLGVPGQPNGLVANEVAQVAQLQQGQLFFQNQPMGPMGGQMPPGMGMMGMQGGFAGNFDQQGKGGGLPGNNFAGFGGPGGPGFNGNFQGGWNLPPQQEQALRRQGRFQEIARYRMNRPVPVSPPLEPLITREYAHRHQTSAGGVRQDWTETVCWQPVLVMPDGKGQVSFDLSDNVTRFQVVAWGHTLNGRLGAATTEFASRLPFSIEPQVPVEITHTDKVVLPVIIANSTDKRRSVQLDMNPTNLRLESKAKQELWVESEARLRTLYALQPSTTQGTANVRILGRCQPFGLDSVERSFKVVAEGFPFVGSRSDLLEGTAKQEVTLPETWISNTLKVQAQVFPSTLADLQSGLEAMLREPGGCFEQSSSSNYPNVLILNYLKESDQALPAVEKRARGMLANGYRKLTSFECKVPQDQVKRRGYEWFGGVAPPHEALTAYGLLEFHDMARVHPVDQDMVQRTRQYLLAQRDGHGGFKRNPQALDSFGRAPQHITDAYIVWALTEAGGNDNLDMELDALTKQARDSKDPYFLALVGNSLINRNRTQDGVDLLKRLAGMQQADGHLTGAQTSITTSGGRDLEIETTGLATLAWLKANRPADFNENVQKAAKWIGRQRGGFGGFGSTQSTILALKALIAFAKENRKTAEAGELRLFVGDSKVPVAVKAFPAGTQDALVVAVPDDAKLQPGKNTLRLEITGKKNHFPYTLAWSYNTLKPANPDGCPVQLKASLGRASANEGETVQLRAVVENKTGKGQGMAVAILGLPGGMELPPDQKQLKEMTRLRDNDTKPGLISAWELRGRELVLYWRDLAPEQTIEVSLDLVCRIPGEYRGPASRAYLYYNADRKFWAEPLSIAIRPKANDSE